jgi:hypothetical protein
MDQMRCPQCKKQVYKQKHEDQFVCSCGWTSRLPADSGIKYEAMLQYLLCLDKPSLR